VPLPGRIRASDAESRWCDYAQHTTREGLGFDYGIPGVQNWINFGWVAVAADYQGLGTPGIHQYSVNRTNAIDAVTIVRAAREMSIGAGTRFGVTGWSQGGGTAAAVLELDAVDLDGLQLIGSVPMSPGVTIVGLEHPTGMGAALAGSVYRRGAQLPWSI